MAAVINTLSLHDVHGPVGKARCNGSGSLQVELRSPSEAYRFATLLREWADWVEESANKPDNMATWRREE